MQIGLKYFSSNNFDEVKKGAEIADYIEIMIEPNTDFTKFKDIKTKFTVHAPHYEMGFNIADKSKEAFNRKAIEYVIKAANLLNADVIVIHPGVIESNNPNTTKENSIKFLNSFNEERFHIENLRTDQEINYLCAESYETKQIIQATNSKFCFDLSHAVVTACHFGIDYKEFIKEFITKIKPDYLHVSDTIVGDPVDNHLSFGKGTFDLDFAKQIIKELDLQVTLETSMDLETRKKEIEFLRN